MSHLDRMLEGMKEYEPDHNEVDEMMDESEKERLLNSVTEKIEKEKETLETKGGRRKKKHINVKQRITKIAAAIALVFITGNVVVVGATMLHLNEKFLSYFGQDELNESEIEENYRKVDATSVDKGVTIEVDQVLGDDHGFYALFSVKGVKDAERVIEPNFRDYNVVIEGIEDDVPISYNVLKIYDDTEDEFSFMLKVNSQNLTGKEISFILMDFGDGQSDDFRSIVDGKWDLKWKLSYQNNAKKIKVNKQIDLYGGKYNWDSISISPLSVSVSTTMIEEGVVHQSDDEMLDLNDEFYVDFADGTRLNKEFMDTDDIYMDGANVSMTFHSIKDFDDVVSVTFAGVTIPVNPDNRQPKQLYVNDEMKFSMQMSDELYNMVQVSEVKSYEDEYLNTSGQYVSFVGELDDAQMTLFSIYRLKGMISPD